MLQSLGLRLWLAAYTDGGAVLVRGGWKQPDFWQFTSSNIPALRGIYNANLDVNRAGSYVWIVEKLQSYLNVAIKAGLKVDNDYGRATAAAVSDFQKSAKLTVDGDAGPLTLAALETRLT